MKTYEEMARDVLKRRDEELARITQTSQINPPPEVVYPAAPKKRGKLGLLPKIAIPCAATILIGAVGLTAWKNFHRGRYENMLVAEGDQPGTPETSDGEVFTFAADQPESIYKGGKTEININEAEYWNVYHLPALLEEDFTGIDDDKINNYYGMEFDRLSRVFPDWKSEHEPFGSYAHDEDDGFVASHRIIFTLNSIKYTTGNGGMVIVAANLIEKYDSADVENAKPSVVNGFDAMIYHFPIYGEYAADIEMGSARVTITTVGGDEEEFLNILDVYTAPDKGSEDNQNNNQNQTMEDKIVILDEAPEYIKTNSWPFQLAVEIDEDLLVGSELIRYSMSELNDFYGINFGCLSELHPDWLKRYTERDLGIRVLDYGDIRTDNMASLGGRAIVRTENRLGYQTEKGAQIQISATLSPLSEEEIGSSVVNGYNAVIFQKLGNNEEVFGYGAAVQMKGTLIFITATNQTEDEFIDLVREYTSEASKFKRSPKPLPTPLPTQN